MDLEKIALNVKKDVTGIYYSNSDSTISYPEEGNESYMQIEEDSFWFSHRNNIIANKVLSTSHEKVFFDIGGGNGFVSKRLQDDGAKVILVEPGKIGAINAHKRGINTILCSTLEDAKFLPNTIDSVGLFDVVEHIEDDFTFLQIINNYMKDEGYIYITVPAFNFLWSNEDDDAGHFRRYSTTKINELLKKSGFTIVYSTYIFSILPLPVFLFRSIPSRLGLNKSSEKLEKHQSEHKVEKGVLNFILQKIWKWELRMVKRNKKIPIGGSCFIIGKKTAKNIN